MVQANKNIKRKTTKEEVLNLKNGEMIPLIKDKYGRCYFNNYSHKERWTFLASIILNMNYKDLEGRVEPLPSETVKDKAIYSKAICDIILDIRLPNNPLILIVELNHFSKDLERLLKELNLPVKAFYDKAKANLLNKSYYYLNRVYGTQEVVNNKYLETKMVIVYNLSTFSINNKDNIFRFTMSDLKHKVELTEKTQFYNLDVANKSKGWYNNKYQESNKEERNLILLSELLVTNKLSIAKKCIDKIDLDIDKKVRELLKGGLEDMYSKDSSDLLTGDFLEDEESYLELKKEILDFANSETVKKVEKEARKDERTKALKIGRAEGRVETQKDTIINSYKENIPLETIARICKTSLSKVNKIIKEYCL